MAKADLETPKKLEEEITNVELMKYAVEQKKSEFQALQGKIAQYKTQLSSLEQRLISLESEHKQKLLLEKQIFEKEKQAKLSDINNRLDNLQKDEASMVHRKVELEERELRVESIKEEKKKILDERLKYESLNNAARLKFDEANNLFGDAVKKMDEASNKERESENKLADVKNIQSIIDKKQEDLMEKELDIQKQASNLKALRNEITPKIEESKELILKNEKVLEEIKIQEEKLMVEKAKNEQMLEAIDNKKRELRAKAIEVDTKQEELLRMKKVL